MAWLQPNKISLPRRLPMRHPSYRAAGVVLLVAVVLYLGAVAYLFVFQRDYVFDPGGTLASPAEKSLPQVEVVTIRTNDGTELTGWFVEASSGRPTILYFHGNSGNISGRAKRFKQILDSGFGLLAVSYRGYPGSGGDPSEAALFSDALEIFDWLAARTTNIVIFGESLGTSVATHVAEERPARALVLEAPFTAALDIAAKTYPWVPVSLLMRDPFLTRDMIVKIDEPLLIVQGTNDDVVPVEQGKRLFALAHEPKKLAIIDGGTHSDLWDHGLWPIVLGFLRLERVTTAP
jgi:fermentation-respiration switch protein FrsA (DUF1100 family)